MNAPAAPVEEQKRVVLSGQQLGTVLVFESLLSALNVGVAQFAFMDLKEETATIAKVRDWLTREYEAKRATWEQKPAPQSAPYQQAASSTEPASQPIPQPNSHREAAPLPVNAKNS